MHLGLFFFLIISWNILTLYILCLSTFIYINLERTSTLFFFFIILTQFIDSPFRNYIWPRGPQQPYRRTKIKRNKIVSGDRRVTLKDRGKKRNDKVCILLLLLLLLLLLFEKCYVYNIFIILSQKIIGS